MSYDKRWAFKALLEGKKITRDSILDNPNRTYLVLNENGNIVDCQDDCTDLNYESNTGWYEYIPLELRILPNENNFLKKGYDERTETLFKQVESLTKVVKELVDAKHNQ